MAASWARRGDSPPIVYDAHTMLASELPSYRTGLGKRLSRSLGGWLDGKLPRAADHIVTVTKDIRRRLIDEHGFDPDGVTVAMNGVELEHFDSSAESDDFDGARIIYTGTLAGYQDFDLLLEAFAMARAERPRLRLTVAASSGFAELEPLARELGVRDAIDLEADSFARLPDRLAQSAIAVLPRTSCDGIPQKLLNYMAAGKAIVASEGSAKLLQHEENGIVVPNGDVAGFARALLRLHDDRSLVMRLGRAARAFVEASCTWDRTAEACENVYAHIMHARGARPSTRRRPLRTTPADEEPTLAAAHTAVSSVVTPMVSSSVPISGR